VTVLVGVARFLPVDAWYWIKTSFALAGEKVSVQEVAPEDITHVCDPSTAMGSILNEFPTVNVSTFVELLKEGEYALESPKLKHR
jgi:hypothetical protein